MADQAQVDEQLIDSLGGELTADAHGDQPLGADDHRIDDVARPGIGLAYLEGAENGFHTLWIT
jgi:hypothetical protein